MGIGCVEAKPGPPGKQLMPDGQNVEQHVARNRAFTGFLSEAMMFALPGGQEADGALLAARLAGRVNLFGRTTYLYQKLSVTGEHLKYGITANPSTRYWAAALSGGSLKILATGSRAEMLELERGVHTYLPIGPEEGQSIYRAIQQALGYRLPPY